jgi:hypothetical protein
MNPTQLELAKRLVACKQQFRWVPGMVSWERGEHAMVMHVNQKPSYIGKKGPVVAFYFPEWPKRDRWQTVDFGEHSNPPHLPDLGDFTTAAVLLRMVMEECMPTYRHESVPRAIVDSLLMVMMHHAEGHTGNGLGTAAAEALLAIWETP